MNKTLALKVKACLLIVQVLHRCSCANTLHTIYRKHKGHLLGTLHDYSQHQLHSSLHAWVTSHLMV